MKHPFKYIVPCLFVLLAGAWLLHFIFPLYYALESRAIKTAQGEAIESKEGCYQTLHLSISDFEKFSEDENELSINGNLYDIVSVEYVHDLVKCTVLKDDKETRLNEQLASHLKSAEQKGRNTKHIVFWCPIYGPPQAEPTHIIYSNTLIAVYFYTTHKHTLNGYISNIIHPPEVLV